MPLELFTFKCEPLTPDQAGVVYGQFTPLQIKDTVVFNSDARGSEAAFKILYSLEAPLEVEAGDYLTALSYSLVER